MLFVPAWFLLGISIYYGDLVARHAISLIYVGSDTATHVHRSINENFGSQILWLKWSVGIMAVWLALYVFWWMYFREVAEE
ncbi:hypothetical protein CEW88_04915 [Alloyangia pacifica]|uniref:Uncharacterized protein n=1 Tax=Alloyangia pacifica TaxID=311180 RepID=A0A2U8HBP8_9RHOB|nr:hypothetical protein CEW88_04915 [Alloyangia pacifica]